MQKLMVQMVLLGSLVSVQAVQAMEMAKSALLIAKEACLPLMNKETAKMFGLTFGTIAASNIAMYGATYLVQTQLLKLIIKQQNPDIPALMRKLEKQKQKDYALLLKNIVTSSFVVSLPIIAAARLGASPQLQGNDFRNLMLFGLTVTSVNALAEGLKKYRSYYYYGNLARIAYSVFSFRSGFTTDLIRFGGLVAFGTLYLRSTK